MEAPGALSSQLAGAEDELAGRLRAPSGIGLGEEELAASDEGRPRGMRVQHAGQARGKVRAGCALEWRVVAAGCQERQHAPGAASEEQEVQLEDAG